MFQAKIVYIDQFSVTMVPRAQPMWVCLQYSYMRVGLGTKVPLVLSSFNE